jgi:hypothetical protein
MAHAIGGLRTELAIRFSEIDTQFSELKSEMDVRFSELKLEITELKSELIKWVFAISFAQAALVISALKFFH